MPEDSRCEGEFVSVLTSRAANPDSRTRPCFFGNVLWHLWILWYHFCLEFKAFRGNFFPHLAAQREIPPHIAQYLFEIVSQMGVSHTFALSSCGIAQVSLRYPFCVCGGRVSHLHFACSPRRKAQKRGRRYRTQLDMLRHQNTGYRWDSLAVSRNTGPLRFCRGATHKKNERIWVSFLVGLLKSHIHLSESGLFATSRGLFRGLLLCYPLWLYHRHCKNHARTSHLSASNRHQISSPKIHLPTESYQCSSGKTPMAMRGNGFWVFSEAWPSGARSRNLHPSEPPHKWECPQDSQNYEKGAFTRVALRNLRAKFA